MATSIKDEIFQTVLAHLLANQTEPAPDDKACRAMTRTAYLMTNSIDSELETLRSEEKSVYEDRGIQTIG